ncbi:LVIVD repeat-containing protein [Saccharicrinis sp. FJH54]|uniref:LVIVD repeat-containing protein n=1 Tax=Saccharicrinis sp. FJH54 TaxID=3344665 RepID=UPI0035D49DDA
MKTGLIYTGMILILIFGSCENSDINFTYNRTDTMAEGLNGSGTGGSMARFTIVGDQLYTVDGYTLKTFDLTDRNKITLKSSWQMDWSGGIETIFPYHNKLFLGTTTGMHIIDISNPDQPQYTSKYEHVVSCDPVVVSGNYAYVTLSSGSNWCNRSVNQLQVINISNITNPKLERTYNMNNPKGLGTDDGLLFVCDNGLKVFKKNSATDLVHINTFTDINGAYDVIPYNGLLILISTDGLRQYLYENDNLTLISSILTN